MKKHPYLDHAQNLCADIVYALESGEEVDIRKKDVETLQWLIQQAKRADMYEQGLCHIIDNDPTSKGADWSKEVLRDAHIRFHPKEM